MKRKRNKGHSHMCKKLKEIYGMQSEDIINILTPDCNVTTMKDLLHKMDIRCKGVDFSSLEKSIQINNSSIMCISYCDNANLKILYPQNLDKEMLDYILAHELAYCCLYSPVFGEYHITTKYDIKKLKSIYNEEDTNNFANSLLENLYSRLPSSSTKQLNSPVISEKENIIKRINNTICLQFHRNEIVDFLDFHENVDIKSPITKCKIPAFYRLSSKITLLFFWLGLFAMFWDLYMPFLNWSSASYIVWCLCWLSLYFTNKVALKEWKKINEKQ